MKTNKGSSKVEIHKDGGISKRTLIRISLVSLLVSIFPHAQFAQRGAENLLKRLSGEEGGRQHEGD